MNNGIGYHVVIDDMSNNDIDNLLNFFIENTPQYVNVKGGERFDKALWFCQQMYYNCPETQVLLRKWPDDGILHRYGYDVQLWYDEIIKPLEDVLLKYENIIWVLDNESMSDDLTNYAIATNEAMELCASKGIGLAVGRFATGNPRVDQYEQLRPMFEGLKKWFGLHIWSPNEYFDQPNTTSGSGSVFRYHEAWDWCKDNLNFIPETVIGEFGLAVNYDPQMGFRKLGLSETDYAKLCLEYYIQWYAPYSVPILVYCIGVWHGFDISSEFRNYIIDNPVNVNIIEKPFSKPIEEKEDNMNFEGILSFLRTLLTRPVLTAILAPLVAWFLSQVPGFPFTNEQILNATIAIVFALIGANTIWESSNALRGNIWNKETRQFEKPE